ncbi:SusC/RagA family TonB-linked outer membrane protein [Mucilaginibacter sp. AW1-3]
MYKFYLRGVTVPALFLIVALSGGTTAAFSQSPANVTDSIAPTDSLEKARQIFLLNKTQQKTSLLQATSTVYTNQLTTTPAPSFLQALPGRLSGLYTRQRSGVQDNDDPTSVIDFRVRGQNPLILVDGVPRDFTSIDPESIESISVLKDALSTVLYGQRSSNNIILVTTKRPVATPFVLSATAQFGLQSLINLPKPVSSADYAILYNEARNNDGLAPVYSAADITAYRNGTDPLGHPNNNYQDLFLNKNAPISRYNINMRSGNDVARFYVALDYENEGGFFKQSGINTYNTNTDIDRYIVRSNVSVDLSKTLNIGLNLFGRIQNSNQPGATTSTVFTALANTPNNAYNIFNADGSLGGNTKYGNNLSGEINNSGYYIGTTRDISADLSITQKLSSLTPGLWVKADISYNNTLDQTVNRSKTFAVYNLTSAPGVTPATYTAIGTNGSQANTFAFNARRTYTYGKVSIGYDKSWGNGHSLNLLALADQQTTTLDLTLPATYTNIAGNAAYNYKQKYFAEASVSDGGFNRFAPGKRFGLFYAAGLGWNLAQENFMKGVSWINVLKPRVNYGRTGNADVGYYVYNQYYAAGGTTPVYYFGSTPTNARGFTELTLANPNATWEKANKFNAGIDLEMFSNRLKITSEYFIDSYFDLMQTPGNSSQLIGQTYPQENLGRNRYSGSETSIQWNGRSGNLNYFIMGNASFLNSKVLFQDEVYRQYDYQKRTGLPVSETFGYVANGFYQSQADINSSPRVDGYSPVPGDIKFKDINNDGVINQLDETAIGSQKPLIYFGFTGGFSIKGFDLSFSFQGVANNNILQGTAGSDNVLTGGQQFAFQNNGLGNAYQFQLNRWTPTNAANATFPRLSIGTNVNNDHASTFWMTSANYLRLQNVDLGYTIPASFTTRFKVNSIRIFANGFNLYAFDKLDHTDPENYNSVYPLRRTFNAGINIKL